VGGWAEAGGKGGQAVGGWAAKGLGSGGQQGRAGDGVGKRIRSIPPPPLYKRGLPREGLPIDKILNYNKTFNYTWFAGEKDASGNIVKKTSRTIEDIGPREDFTRSQRTPKI